MRRFLTLLACLSAVSAPSAALALNQPDGTPIPAGNGLAGLFASRGEGINALNDAQIIPETFVPSCGLTFEVLQRNAGYNNSFGWYNVTNGPPPLSDLHEFLSCTDGVGTVKTLNIKNDPGYKGGDIGFYQATGDCGTVQNHEALFYSERKYNSDSNQANPFIHLLIYNSTVTAKAFYFGWEDLIAGGDNDFDDLTTFVTGISCAGGGGKCQTGSPGVCADGTLQCQVGMLECIPLVGPSNEKCDGFDNDCNAMVDDGDICPAGQVCDNGNCVPKCGGEFQCAPGQDCDDAKGLCVDPQCIGVVCMEGTKCIQGTCKDPCNGAVCPKGQACIAGNCIDPCLAITCDESQVCSEGACIDKCQCAGCAAANQCQPGGLCIPDACVGKMCPPGQICAQDGSCADACMGVVCPAGQACMMGQCAPDPNATGSGGGGAGGMGVGGFAVGGGGSGMTTGTGGAGGQGGSQGGAGGGAGQGGSQGKGGGCGCRTAEGDAGGLGAAAAAAVFAVALGRRRRARRGGQRQ